MTVDSWPLLGPPRCEWVRPGATHPCGRPATCHMTTHDFPHETNRDPNATRLWLMCPDCALLVLKWVQREQNADSGSWCKDCNTMVKPMLGGFLISHGEIAHPEQDVTYERP